MAKKVSVKRKDNKGRILRTGESQRADGRYQYRYKNSLGQTKYIYSSSLPELREEEERIEKQKSQGLTGEGDKLTLNEAWERYMQSKRGLRATTKQNYTQAYNCYVRNSALGKMPVGEIKFSVLKDFYNGLVHDKHLKISTIKTLAITLNPMFETLVRDDIIRANPTKDVMKSIKQENNYSPTKRHSMTIDEQEAIIRYMSESPVYGRWVNLFVFMLSSGLRVSEVCGLTWSDIDFENGTLSVNRELMKRSLNGTYGYHVSVPKTKGSVRTIPLLPDARLALTRHKKSMDHIKNDFVLDGLSGFVWLTKDGVPLNHQNVDGVLNRVVDAYNRDESRNATKEGREPFLVRKISAHSLRHTCATRLCEATDNVAFVAAYLGHSNIQTTLNIYAECQPDFMQRTAEEIAEKMSILA